MPGFSTLTTTSSPSGSTAPCTCASDAVAIGWDSNDANASGTRRPNPRSISWMIFGVATGRKESKSLPSSSVYSVGRRS